MRSFVRIATAVALAGAACVMAPTANAAGIFGSGSSSCGYTTINGHTYRCTFDDEFSSTRLDTTKWVVNPNLPTGDPNGIHACSLNDPRFVSVSSGALHLTVGKISTPVSCGGWSPTNIVAPTVSSYHLFSQQYGRFEARIRVPVVNQPGLGETFWMWPDDRYSTINWPTSGEMDVAQLFSSDPLNSYPFLHYGNDSWITGTTIQQCAAQRGVWNTYDLDWTATSITVSINGTTCMVNTSADPAFQKRYIMALSEAIDGGSNAPSSSFPYPATMDVDYVRVWQAM